MIAVPENKCAISKNKSVVKKQTNNNPINIWRHLQGPGDTGKLSTLRQ